MDSLDSLRAVLSVLEIERSWIKQQPFVEGCWIARYKPGGASRAAKTYWQLRSTKATLGGKKAKHLKTGEVGEYQTQIARGRRLRQLNRQIAALQKRIDQVERTAARLGISLERVRKETP